MFSFNIQGTGEVIEDHEFGLADEHPGSRGALKLTTRKADASRSHQGLKPSFHFSHIFIEYRGADCGVYIEAVTRQTEEDIVLDGLAEEAGYLPGIGAAGWDQEGVRFSDGFAVPEHLTGLGWEQAEENLEQSGFPDPIRPVMTVKEPRGKLKLMS